jgi:hypothetical protein
MDNITQVFSDNTDAKDINELLVIILKIMIREKDTV